MEKVQKVKKVKKFKKSEKYLSKKKVNVTFFSSDFPLDLDRQEIQIFSVWKQNKDEDY